MMRAIPKIAVDFVKTQEGRILRVYDDKQPKKILKPGDAVIGVLTGGYGKTGGLEVGQKVTAAQAEAWLLDDIDRKAARPLFAKIGTIVNELTEHQYAALLSFVFNLGTGDPKKPEWTIWKRLRARQFNQVALEIPKFINWDGRPSPSLAARRAREVELWHAEDVTIPPDPLPSSVTRREPTPPTPASAVAPQRSATVIGTATTAVGTTAVAGKAVYDAVQPFAKDSPTIENAIATIAICLAVLAAISALLVFLQKRRQRN